MKTIELRELMSVFNKREIRKLLNAKTSVIAKNLIARKIDKINKITDQENDPVYMAYFIEHLAIQNRSILERMSER